MHLFHSQLPDALCPPEGTTAPVNGEAQLTLSLGAAGAGKPEHFPWSLFQGEQNEEIPWQ